MLYFVYVYVQQNMSYREENYVIHSKLIQFYNNNNIITTQYLQSINKKDWPYYYHVIS